MVHNLAERITDWLIKNGTISEQSRESYVYGVEVSIERFTTYAVLLILSIVLEIFIPSILFILFFVALRGYAGGFHVKTFWGCFISTIVLYLVYSKLIAPFCITHSEYVIPTVILSFFIIMLLAPLNHPNLNMNQRELHRCKVGARIVAIIEVMYIILGILCGINTVYVVFPFLGTLLCTVLLIVEKLNQKEVKQDEKQLNEADCFEACRENCKFRGEENQF